MDLIRRTARKIIPGKSQAARIEQEKKRLQRLDTLTCDVAPLGLLSPERLHEILNSPATLNEWPTTEKEIASLHLDDAMGSMNFGDRRAIYTLVRGLRPSKVLEIGTHLGASTAHFAYALKKLAHEDPQKPYTITTVDIVNVNNPVSQRWKRYGAEFSPKQILEKLRCEDRVTFVTKKSLDYFATNSEKYDLILLDGNHSAVTVYKELPAALQALALGGYILLHDYFPDLQPLWSNGAIIPGPWLAIQRHKETTPELAVIPLGALPWPTKLGSNVTSLALVTRTS